MIRLRRVPMKASHRTLLLHTRPGVFRPKKQIVCALLLLTLAVGVSLAARAVQSPASGAPAPLPQSTALNGPGNVFLTAGLSGSGGPGTVFVAIGDFNGDGKLDYITAQDGNNTTTLGIAIGNGD